MVEDGVKKFKECQNDPERSHLDCVYGWLYTRDYILSRMRIGLYYVHIRAWLTAFPTDQLMVIRLEDYSQNPPAVLHKIHSFLGIQDISVEDIEKYVNSSEASKIAQAYQGGSEKLNDATRKMLMDFYRPYNEKLVQLMGDKRFLYED